MIANQYRRDYPGEFVIVNTDIRRGIKQQRREWMPNPIINQHISGRAAVIGSNIDQNKFDYGKLQRHRGGLQGKLRLQTYGSGSIWEDMRLDFYCSTDRPTLSRLQSGEYHNTTTCYSNARFCMIFPKKFYMIPFQPRISDLAAAIYLAAFDGHREIFMLGYNQDTPCSARHWQQDVTLVMQAYNSHQFVFVGPVSNMPAIWRDRPNADFWDYRKFVTHCDI
jgi:hypothetical protein